LQRGFLRQNFPSAHLMVERGGGGSTIIFLP